MAYVHSYQYFLKFQYPSLVRLEAIAVEADLCFTRDVLFQSRDRQDALADQRKILQVDQT